MALYLTIFCSYFGRNDDFIKFVYSEKATKFCEISTLLLSTVHTDKSKVEILQNIVAFSEYMNFKSKQNLISIFFRKKQVRSWQLFVRVIPRRLTDQKDTQINWSPLVGAAVVLHPHQRPPQLRVASNQTTLSPE